MNKVIITTLAKQSMDNIYAYNYQYSVNKAIRVDRKINLRINQLEFFPYIGRYSLEIEDKRFRELIYNEYRIVYSVFENLNTIYIWYVFNGKQNALKIHKKYFKDINLV